MERFTSPEDVLEWLQAYSASAAFGAALELGLPWLLAAEPMEAVGIARALGIPIDRCRWWLRRLEQIGLLEHHSGGYAPSAGANRAILGSYSRESWAVLAAEERERFPSVLDLAPRLTLPAAGPAPPPGGLEGYVRKMVEDPERAGAFTRMLYELHLPLADALARILDMAGVHRIVDLGGGSGVMSLALLRRHPDLTSVVVDIENVCAAGRQIAAENQLEDRIAYLAADLVGGALPGGFDLALECDVGIYTEPMFSQVRASLEEGGRFVIVDQLAETEDAVPARVLHWTFTASITQPSGAPMTTARLKGLLADCGFTVLSESALPDGYQLIEARA